MGGTGGRRVGHGLGIASADIAALAVHIMTNTALTGATYDIDCGQLPARLQLAGFLPDHVRALLAYNVKARRARSPAALRWADGYGAPIAEPDSLNVPASGQARATAAARSSPL